VPDNRVRGSGVKRPNERWGLGSHPKMPVYNVEAETVRHRRLNAFPHAYRHCAKHERVSHSFIFYSVRGLNLMPMFLEMNVTLILIYERHRQRDDFVP